MAPLLFDLLIVGKLQFTFYQEQLRSYNWSPKGFFLEIIVMVMLIAFSFIFICALRLAIASL